MVVGQQTAYFAAGCFWGVQYYFDQIPGVIRTEVGYSGGDQDNPTYETVLTQTTGHAETLKIIFKPKVISYMTLLRHFFRMHDPTQLNQQGPDVGSSYRSAIFYTNAEQREQAEALISKLNSTEYNGNIATVVEKFKKWWPAENYHQKFTERTGRGMCHISYEPLD